MKAKIDLEKFICSYVKWNNIQDSLKEQGLKCWNGEIVEIENEDEKIRKAQLDYWRSVGGKEWHSVPVQEVIAWLEKQGEQKPTKYTLEQAAHIFLDALSDTPYNNSPITDAQVITNELLKFLANTSSYNPNTINEQKPVDKVEPKFHQGDWVVSKTSNLVYHVDSILLPQSKCYYLSHDGGLVIVSFTDEQNYHLWTIQDAKDGDVLIASDNSVFIYAGSADRHAKFYAALTKYSALNLEGGNWEDKNRVHPATKEQRDALEKAMAEAGYTFDFDKKELIKIEQKLSNSAKIGMDEE